MSAPPRVIYIDKFSVVDCLKDIGGDWEYILKSDYDELQAKLKSTERELAKWKEPFDQEKFDAAAKQASHKDSLAAMCVYQTALEHALKHHQAKLTETQRLNAVAKGFIVVSKDLLAEAIACNTDASLADARHIINSVLKVSDDEIFREALKELEQ